MNDYELKKLYEEMELHLIKSMKRNLGKHLLEEKEIEFEYPQWQAIKLKELKRYQKENKKIIGRYVFGLEKDVTEHLQNELKQGAINAINQYNNLNKKKLNRNKLMNKSFFKTNDKKIKALIKVVNDDLNIANASALRMINDQYRQIIHKSAFFVGNGVFTEQQAARMAVDEISEKKLTTLAIDEASKNFLAGGLNCIEYKNGRRVNIASYSQMAVRTASLRAQLMGEGDFRKSIGRTLVKVTTHGGACKLCTGWQGKVLVDDVYSGGKADGKHTLLSEAMKQGFLHPNCRHGLTTYYPELEEDNDEEYEDDVDYINEKMNYINRNIKKYNRLEKGSFAPLNIQQFARKKNSWITEANKVDYGTYYDVTNAWIDTSKPNSHKIVVAKSYTHDGIRYKVDGKKVVLDYSLEERNIAEWLESTFGGKIKINPRINEPEGIKTSDYFFRDKKWDLKTINGNSSQVLYHAIYKKKTQSNNFIFDITKSKLSIEEAIEQIKKIYQRPDTNFVNRVLIKKNKEFKVFIRK